MWLIVLQQSLRNTDRFRSEVVELVFLLSLVMLGASIGLHKCGHGTFFRHQRLNEGLDSVR